MKIVVKDVSSATVSVAAANYASGLFLARHGDAMYVLQHDTDGWIFRSVINSSIGHSSKHDTPSAAVSFALTPTTKIFQFDTFVELAQYVVAHTKP